MLVAVHRLPVPFRHDETAAGYQVCAGKHTGGAAGISRTSKPCN